MAEKKYILVADDDRFYSEIYKAKLAEEGYDVTVVGNGAEAVASAGERRPDLIILDMVMPIMNGFDALLKLKQMPEVMDVPVLVLSSLGQEEDAAKVREAGAAEFFIKTDLTMAQLMAVIKKYCVSS